MPFEKGETVIALTTLARVKTYLNKTDSDDDAILTNIINHCSAQAMRKVMERPVELKARSEYFDVEPGQKTFRVQGNPVDLTKTITVRNDISTPRDWTGDVVDPDYVMCPPVDAEWGIITVEYPLSSGKQALKITYEGGMAADTSGIITSYPEIANAMDMQVGYMWRNKNLYGIQSEGIQGANFTFYRPIDWLSIVFDTLDHFRRGSRVY